MATTKRRPQKENKIKPDYESPADNKYTFCAGTEDEFTLIFRMPVGRENRKKTAELLPLFRHVEKLMGDGGAVDPSKFMEFFDITKDLWNEDEFEEVYLPFALGVEPDDERLEKVGLMDAFMGFMQAIGFILGGSLGADFKEAEKNLPDEAEPAE